MKNIRHVIVLANLFFAFSTAMAQKDSSGIYKTVSDFQHKKLSYAINNKTEKHKIKDNILFNGSEIKVKHNGQTYEMDKKSTYGLKNTKGEVYRFIDKKEYRILNPDAVLLIYEYKHLAHSPKEAEKYSLMYYFSIDASAAPQDLTKANLKAAFPNYHKFHDALDANFKEDKELTRYDDFHKMYKINWIFENTVK